MIVDIMNCSAMAQEPILYLDYNATTPLKPDVITVMTQVLGEVGNASSIHAAGRHARKRVEDARAQVGRSVGVDAKQVIFTSCATESNNTILRGMSGKRILISAIEHLSILEGGVPAEQIPVTKDGVVDVAAFKKMMATGDAPALVSVMLVNNETGVIQPVAEIAKIAKEAGAIVHCDVAQAIGRIPVVFTELNADFLTLSSHKIGGPQGMGATIMAVNAPLPKLLQGGGQERRQRAGTENVAGIAGFGLAVEQAIAGMNAFQNLSKLRDRLEAELRRLTPGLIVHGVKASRVSNTSCFTAPGITSETILMNLDLEHIAISSGSACSSGTIKPSHVLLAMGVGEDDARCAVRVSMGWNTTEKDIDRFLSVWEKVTTRLKK